MKLGQIEGGEDQEEGEEKKALIKAPAILRELGYVEKDEWWLVLKAFYGYKQSPRLWSDYRDEELTKLKVSEEGRKFRLQQLLSEPNIWKILEVKR